MKNKFFIIIAGIFFSLIGIVSAHVGDDYYDHHGWMMGNYWSFGWAFMWMFMSLIIVGLVLLIIYLIKKIQNEDKIKNKRR
jgi:uncharacterized membrane protein